MPPPDLLTRRAALARLALVLGGALVGADAILSGKPLEGKTRAEPFTADEIARLDEIGDTIVPATRTPGAKAVQIGAFMAMMVRDCYDDAQEAAFRAGIVAIDGQARARFGRDFLAATPEERTSLLNELDAEQRRQAAATDVIRPVHFFRMMKQLTLLGYFTSEIGATQALRFTEVPGRYDGNEPYRPGDRNYFSPPSRSV